MTVVADFFLLCLALAVLSAAQTQSFTPAAIPIAARSPYLLNFLPTSPSAKNSRTWQAGYSTQIQAWAGLIRVDGLTYAWAGNIGTMPPNISDPTPVGTGVSLTPTTSVFTYTTGPVQVTVTFLSPIEPGNLVNQSIPASYVALDIKSTDGASHSVQVYTDITAEWVSGDRSQNVTWSTTSDSATIYHAISTVTQAPYREIRAQAAWGKIYYATLRSDGTTFRTGGDLATRGQFVQNGTLDNTQDTNFRGITVSFPVFAFAQDLGTITQTTAPLVWAAANIRDSSSTGVVTYTDLSGQTQIRSLLYRTQYADDGTLLNSFLADFPTAFNRSQTFDKSITQAAINVGGSDYADILSLATRQAYSGIEITVGRDGTGAVNASDVMAFYKDTGIQDSGNNNAQVSPVDGLISVFPAFLYTDPALCGALLEPLLRFQDSSSYTNQYAALNLGPQYPTAVANGDSHPEGIETSSGMIIMAYGHVKATGDLGIIGRYYTLLKTWADYLSANTLDASSQTSADGITHSGQANLALKGIIALQAMSKISTLQRNSTDAKSYSSQATSLYAQWSAMALASDGHILFSYDESSSFSLGYNMFWDLLLETGLLNTTVFDNQTIRIANSIQTFGASTDSTNTSAVSANWNMFAAAIATQDTSVRQALISATHKLAAEQSSGKTALGQFPLMYTSQEGALITGQSSPRQGAAYAPLLVNASSFLAASNGSGTSAQGDKASTPVGAIVGGTLGGIAVLSLFAAIFFLIRRRRNSVRLVTPTQQGGLSMREAILADASPIAHTPGVTPFVEVDLSRPPASSATEGSSASEYYPMPEADTKRAYRLRRIPNEELAQRTAMAHGSPASTAYPTTSPSAISNQSDPALGQGLLQEINSLWREISAMRTMSDGTAPPEYGA